MQEDKTPAYCNEANAKNIAKQAGFSEEYILSFDNDWRALFQQAIKKMASEDKTIKE